MFGIVEEGLGVGAVCVVINITCLRIRGGSVLLAGLA